MGRDCGAKAIIASPEKVDGIMIFAYMIAAGTDKIEAVMKCWIKFSSPNEVSRILINATITEPATVAMPAVININNSLLDNLLT